MNLNVDEIDIWMVGLEQFRHKINDFVHWLSTEEKGRAEQFCFEIDRFRFITRRGLLRKLLSLYSDIHPKYLMLECTEKGKPYLDRKFRKGNIGFNLSHSNGLCVYAISKCPQIGVDLEFVRYLSDVEGLIKHFFTEKEECLFHSLPDDKRQDVFFTWWTRKEALIKAIGAGLSFPLNAIDVSDVQKTGFFPITEISDVDKDSQWSILPLKINSSFKASVAVNMDNIKINYRNL
jgi:4'-phosphopantetheinyl transferase